MSKAIPPSSVVEVFFSYAPEDGDLRKKLVDHLKLLERNGVIKVWHDRKILPGQDRNSEVSAHLQTADIVLLLISSDFMASDYLYGMEMLRAIERHKAKEARVVPIILRPCDWEDAPFSDFGVLPDNKIPCTQWPDINSAFLNVTQGLKAIVRAIKGEASLPESMMDKLARKEIPPLLPYLCDRDDQENDLENVVLSRLESHSENPILCVIYGSEEECHDMFRERLQKRSFYRIMGAQLQARPIDDVMLPLPPNLDRLASASDDEKREAFFRVAERNLAKKFLGKLQAPKQEIVEAISQFKNPVIIHSSLGTVGWESHGSKVVLWFIEFWNQSWLRSSGTDLFVCLHIEFDRKREEFRDNEQKVRDFLGGLDRTKYTNLHVTPLSELIAVSDEEAKRWVRNEENFEGFCRIHGPRFCEVQTVVNEIIALYRQPDMVDLEGRISMLKLAPKLKRLIETNYCQRNSV